MKSNQSPNRYSLMDNDKYYNDEYYLGNLREDFIDYEENLDEWKQSFIDDAIEAFINKDNGTILQFHGDVFDLEVSDPRFLKLEQDLSTQHDAK